MMKFIEIDEKALREISGGLSISGAVINSFTTGIKVVLDLGRSFGTAARRVQTGNLCKM